jgi:hypothetical protein
MEEEVGRRHGKTPAADFQAQGNLSQKEGRTFTLNKKEPRILMVGWPEFYDHCNPKKSNQESSGNLLGFHPKAEKNRWSKLVGSVPGEEDRN